MDHSCQTEAGIETYEQRMAKVESEYLRRVDYFKLTNAATLEERLTAVRRECEQRYRAQLEHEVERLRTAELPAL